MISGSRNSKLRNLIHETDQKPKFYRATRRHSQSKSISLSRQITMFPKKQSVGHNIAPNANFNINNSIIIFQNPSYESYIPPKKTLHKKQNSEMVNKSVACLKKSPTKENSLSGSRAKLNISTFSKKSRKSVNYPSGIFSTFEMQEEIVLSPAQLSELFIAKCLDLKLNCQVDQEKRFYEYCLQKCVNGKLILREVSI